MKLLLNKIIEEQQIKIVFQPIVSLRDGSIFGHEALTRINLDCDIKNPALLFELSEKYNRVWDLELLCRTKALETAFIKMEPPYRKKLFLNVNPNIMHDEKFHQGFTKEYLSKYGITPHHVIFEITERDSIKDMNSFKRVIHHYKNQDYKIAIDDAGAGYSGLNLISDVAPHYIKLDMNLVRDIDKDNIKYALVKSMIELSHLANISLVAEGIETKHELETLVNLGVQYGQGYYIQKPDTEIHNIKPKIIAELKEMNRKKNDDYGNHVNNICIETLCIEIPTISPHTKVETVMDIFKQQPDLMGVCVINRGIPKGIITKTNLYLQIGGRYGYSLNQNKRADSLMDKEFLQIDYQTPINAVSHIAMSRPNDKIYDFIVITKDGEYLGTVTIKDLLQKTTYIEVINAKHQNPLTGLPGNLMIEKQITETVKKNHPYCVMYFDIDHFKAYNDKYGFEAGDIIIKLLAKTISKHTTSNQFVGHIGGDDFVIVSPLTEGNALGEKIIADFEKEVMKYYNDEDLHNGFIISENRKGAVEKFPLISLSIAAITNKTSRYRNMYEVTEKLAMIKKKSKQIKGSCYYEVS